MDQDDEPNPDNMPNPTQNLETMVHLINTEVTSKSQLINETINSDNH